MKSQLTIKSEAEMASFAYQLWQEYGLTRDRAVIFALEGQLGAGKTTFAKAIASVMGISEIILSPTFILHEEYPHLDHIDTWRMESPQELLNLGLKEMIAKKNIILIEWADKFKTQILKLKSRSKIIWIKFDYAAKDNERRITYEDISN